MAKRVYRARDRARFDANAFDHVVVIGDGIFARSCRSLGVLQPDANTSVAPKDAPDPRSVQAPSDDRVVGRAVRRWTASRIHSESGVNGRDELMEGTAGSKSSAGFERAFQSRPPTFFSCAKRVGRA